MLDHSKHTSLQEFDSSPKCNPTRKPPYCGTADLDRVGEAIDIQQSFEVK